MEAFFNWISEFFSSGLYTLITEAFASLIEWLMLLKLKMMLWSLEFAWGIANSLISSLGISTAIENAWGSFSGPTLSNLMFFKVPDALNMIVSAIATRFVLRFLPIGL